MNWKHVSKKVLKWFAVAFGVLVIGLALVFLLLQTDTGRKSLVRMAGNVLSEGGRKIEIGNVTGVVPFHFLVETMSFSDEQGALLKVGELEIDWAPLSMLKG